MVASLLLPLTGANITVKVHPVVLLQICDAYIRRNDKQDRVIGTLLGTATESVVTVSRCYVVPHNESADQVSSLTISRHGRPSCMQQGTSLSAAFEQ
jgi:translation initiation factor 3 subunit F